MKVKLAKTSTSRTRAKAKIPVSGAAELRLKEAVKREDLGFIDYLLAKGYSNTTIAQYIKDIHRFKDWATAENTPVTAAGHNDILHYLQSRKVTISQRTAGIITNSLKHYYNYLISFQIIKENPVTSIKIKGVKRKKLHHILTKPELESLYYNYEFKDEPKDENQNWYKTSQLSYQRNKAIVGLMVYQGLNATELMKLTEKDIQLRAGKIFIAGTRRSNERELKLESVQILDLMEYTLKTRAALLQIKNKTADQLFTSISGSSNIHNTLFNLLGQLQKINSKVTSLKQIRTSVITHWLKVHNLREVQYMAGHRYVSSTEAYKINDLEDLHEDITKYHPI